MHTLPAHTISQCPCGMLGSRAQAAYHQRSCFNVTWILWNGGWGIGERDRRLQVERLAQCPQGSNSSGHPSWNCPSIW